MTKIIKFELTSFQYFSSSTNGGILSLSDSSLFVKCCSFYKDKASQQGGCIYANNTNINISKTTFTKCYSISNENGIFGNVMYVQGGNALVTNCETFLCGESETLCGDGSIIISNALTEISYFNASTNHGCGGSAGFGFGSCQTGSFGKFCTIFDARDWVFVVIWEKSCNISSCNFIKAGPGCKALIMINQDNITTIENSIITEIGSIPLSFYSKAVIFINCDIDNTSLVTAGLTYKTDISFVTFEIDMLSCATKKIQKNTCHKNRISFGISLKLTTICLIKQS